MGDAMLWAETQKVQYLKSRNKYVALYDYIAQMLMRGAKST